MRLFVGIELPQSVKDALGDGARTLARAVPGRYAPPQNFHITLAFLGETPPERLEALYEAVARAAAGMPPAELALERPRYFGRRENAILYAGVFGWRALAPLDFALRTALVEAGFSFDPKPFFAHVTLARHANLPDELPDAPWPPTPFDAKTVAVFHSDRVNGVLTYTPIFRTALSRR